MFLFKRRTTPEAKPLDPAGHKKSRRLKIFFLSLAAVIIIVIGYVAGSGWLALKRITADSSGNGDASFFKYGDTIPADALGTEGDGRVNILVIGVGGSSHPGGNLADSIMVISFDSINKKTSLLSIPRDLYVQYSNKSYGKINGVYAAGLAKCGTTCATGDQGAKDLKDVLKTVLDLPIQYYVRVDFTGFQKLVDAVGGVDVTVDKALIDPYYPDEKMQGYAPLKISAGAQKFDGKTALKYARSRETTSDFDRARRQQQIAEAIAKKATSAGVLANPKKLVDIFNALGDHFRTDFDMSKISQLAELVKNSNFALAEKKVLDTSAGSVLTSSTEPKAGYIIYPKSGKTDFTQLQEEIHKFLPEPYLVKENAKVAIAYDVTQEKNAKTLETHLKAYGYNIVELKKVETVTTQTSMFVQRDMPYTVKLLTNRLKAKTVTTNPAKTAFTKDEADIIVFVGKDLSSLLTPTAKAKVSQK